MRRRFYIILALALALANSISAQNSFFGEKKMLRGAELSLSFCDSWEIVGDASYSMAFNNNFGWGIGIMFRYAEDAQADGIIKNNPKYARWENEDDKVKRISARINTYYQNITPMHIKNVHIGYRIEPGIILSLPYANEMINYRNHAGFVVASRDLSKWAGEWCAIDCRFKVLFLSKKSIGVALWYGISTSDIYSSKRKIGVDGTRLDPFYPKKRSLYNQFGISIFGFDY